MIRSWAVGLVLVFALTVRAADDKPFAGPAPSFVFARAEEKGDQVRLVVTVTEYVPEQRVLEVQVGGRLERKTQTVMVPVQKVVVFELDGKRTALQRADGKAVDNKDVAKELGPGKLILSALHGKPDPRYLKLFKDDTLILMPSDK